MSENGHTVFGILPLSEKELGKINHSRENDSRSSEGGRRISRTVKIADGSPKNEGCSCPEGCLHGSVFLGVGLMAAHEIPDERFGVFLISRKLKNRFLNLNKIFVEDAGTDT
jgi:hypothetical protein